MDRSMVVNAALALAAIGTLGVVVATRETPTSDELAARASNLFPEFSRARLTRVEARGSLGSFVLAFEAAVDGGEPSARLVSPPSAAGVADPEAAEQLARTLEVAAFLRRFEATDVERGKLWLATPRAELRVVGRGFDATLRVGKPAASPAGTTYVEVRSGSAPSHIGLVRDELIRQLLVPADDLRPRALSSLAASELVALSFRDERAEVALKRGQGPAWLDAKGTRVSRDAVERLVLELSRVKAERFFDGATAGMPASALAVRLVPEAPRAPLAFRIGDACPGVPDRLLLVRESPVAAAFCVTPATREIFHDTTARLRDDSPFVLHADEVEALMIERGREKLELRRNERGFRLHAPTTADVELEAGNERLEVLIGAQGELVASPDLGALGLLPPSGTVRLTSTVIERTPRFEEVIELGRPAADGRLPVRRREDGAVLVLSREAARATAVDTTLLRSREILGFGPSELVELSLEIPGERQLLRRSAAGLELVEPRGPGHDPALVLDLVQALGTLRADRWIADADDGSFGLERPRIVVRAKLQPTDAGTRDVTLRVGAQAKGGAYAQIEPSPGVFLLPRAVESELSTLVLSRDRFGTEPDSIASVSLVARDRRLRLERRGDGFIASPRGELVESAIERLIRAIAALRPEAAIHTGAARPEEGFATPTLVLEIATTRGGAPKTIRLGAGDTWRDTSIFYARVDGIDATYALSQGQARELLDSW